MSPTVFAVVCAFIFGLNIGSFLNVVIWRLPRGGSLTEPQWSYCPKCEKRLVAADLVPVFSFLLLGRKCRYCHQPISWRYPAIETLTALLFMAVAWRFGLTLDTVFYCLFAAALVCVFFIDLEHFIIPDGLNVTLAVIGFAHNAVAIYTKQSLTNQFTTIYGHHVPASIVGFVVYAFLVYFIGLLSYMYLVGFVHKNNNPFKAGWEYIVDNVIDWLQIGIWYASRVVKPLRKYAVAPEPLEGFTADEIEADEDSGGMGGGDGKLAAGIGANLFILLAMQSFFIAIFVGAFVGVIVMIRNRKRFGDRPAIPFGPHMAIGALVALLFSANIVNGWNWYYNYATRAAHPQANVQGTTSTGNGSESQSPSN